MTLEELKTEVKKYQYFEDDTVIDFSLACLVSNILRLGDPVWAVIIGASSGGKSQLLRPLSLTNPKVIHRLDDLTENTFLSGMKVKKGDEDPSLLKRIGDKGIIVMSDLTVLFSKNKESRGTILSQFRMLYDGEMTKYSGTSGTPLHWKGYLGVLAGATPSLYPHFEEVADMGERFIYYRMKDYDAEKATRLALKRTLYGAELDVRLGDLYGEYLKQVVKDWAISGKLIELTDEMNECIIQAALFAERVRTSVQMDFQKKEVIRKPVTAYATRVALQLTTVARALYVIRGGKTTGADMEIINWCAYSLANEEKRGILKIIASQPYETAMSTQKVADLLGLSTTITGHVLQNLSAVKVLIREGDGSGLRWRINLEKDWKLIRKVEDITEDVIHVERALSSEEHEEMEKVAEEAFLNF